MPSGADDTASDDATRALLANESDEDAVAAVREAAPEMTEAEAKAYVKRLRK